MHPKKNSMRQTSMQLLEPAGMISLKKSAGFYRAINHKLRRQIIELLHKNKRLKVTDIVIKLKLEQSQTSQHLAILRAANIVTTEREGKFIYYSVNYTRIQSLHHQGERLLKEPPANK
jgi:DNA-binding transcriptional ArsR family regulator